MNHISIVILPNRIETPASFFHSRDKVVHIRNSASKRAVITECSKQTIMHIKRATRNSSIQYQFIQQMYHDFNRQSIKYNGFIILKVPTHFGRLITICVATASFQPQLNQQNHCNLQSGYYGLGTITVVFFNPIVFIHETPYPPMDRNILKI